MNIEIKHLAPYYPYKLMMRFIDSDGFGGFPDVELKNLNPKTISDSVAFKPLLRPLSDLTEEIEHNGEKFIPATVLWSYNPRPNIHVDIDDFANNEWIERLDDSDLRTMDYLSVAKLFEWHFDVFGLIEEGLAIKI